MERTTLNTLTCDISKIYSKGSSTPETLPVETLTVTYGETESLEPENTEPVGFGLTRDVTHEREYLTSILGTSASLHSWGWHKAYTGTSIYGIFPYAVSDLPCLYMAGSGTHIPQPPAVMSYDQVKAFNGALYRAMKNSIPSPDANASIINTIIELRELKQLIDSPGQLFNQLKRVDKLSMQARRSMKLVDAIEDLAASGLLVWNFGVKTTIAEFNGLLEASRQARMWARRYESMLACNKLKLHRSTGKSSYVAAPEVENLEDKLLFGSNHYVARDRVKQTFCDTDFKCQLKYRIKSETLEATAAGLTLDSPHWRTLGIPKNVWEFGAIVKDATPWSWAIEYLSEIFDVYDVMANELPAHVDLVSYDIHTTQRFRTSESATLRYEGIANGLASDPHVWGDVELQGCKRVYKRRSFPGESFMRLLQDSGISSLDMLKTPTSMQQANVVAALRGFFV